MVVFDLREPINAWSHGAGMMVAVPVAWILYKRCEGVSSDVGSCARPRNRNRYQRVKAFCVLVFGVTLTACYGLSALFHSARLTPEPLRCLQRLDHIGIFLLIAGTYTPIAWSLMRGSWLWGTLSTVWTTALICSGRVWYGGLMPVWASTLIYLAMGWGALFCYFELARRHSHGTLLPLPLGGVFYSIGALINLAHWPVLVPSILAAHELFHFFVIAGSACHVFFMLRVVVPAQQASLSSAPSKRGRLELAGASFECKSLAGRWSLHLSTGRPNGRKRFVGSRNDAVDPLSPEAPDRRRATA
jgi:hemolysin III